MLHPEGRALVLAGAGAAGNAWELGLVAGLAEGGVDVTRAELVIGTSAGSTVAAQITSGTSPDDLYAAAAAELPPHAGAARRERPPGSPGAPGTRRGLTVSGPSYLEWSDAIIASASDPADLRRRLGAAALELASTAGPDPSRWRDVVASRLPSHEWPSQDVRIVAVDARTGEPVVFDRSSGVDLVDAVAASTSAMKPYPIGEKRYLNGGYRRSENADLANGFGRVLVMSPFSGRSRMPSGWGMDLATQVAELRAAGSTVETVFPDDRSGDVFDANALDPATRPQAARGGHAQGLELAEHVGHFWA
ncbi:MAG: patatin-like phospholipase family protein [Dermatophilaceae bacterium]|nr:patatin-like phospholipase family protein [Dermatophilaceae bacterium]